MTLGYRSSDIITIHVEKHTLLVEIILFILFGPLALLFGAIVIVIIVVNLQFLSTNSRAEITSYPIRMKNV